MTLAKIVSIFAVTGLAVGLLATARAQMFERQTAPLQSPSELKAKPRPNEPAAPATIAPAARTAAGRSAFAARVAAAFKSGGYALRVVAEERGSGDARQFPKLAIAGAFDEPFVFKLISTWPFLAPAMKSGFRSVDIVSLLDRRHYLYDFSSGALPRCDTGNRVCN